MVSLAGKAWRLACLAGVPARQKPPWVLPLLLPMQVLLLLSLACSASLSVSVATRVFTQNSQVQQISAPAAFDKQSRGKTIMVGGQKRRAIEGGLDRGWREGALAAAAAAAAAAGGRGGPMAARLAM
jgi:hypothetical protein